MLKNWDEKVARSEQTIALGAKAIRNKKTTTKLIGAKKATQGEHGTKTDQRMKFDEIMRSGLAGGQRQELSALLALSS